MNTQNEQIRLFGLADDSIVDGPGVRLAIFTQGCSHACPGCHNPEAQPFAGGTLTTAEDLVARVRANPLLSGITLTGGEPFEQAKPLVALARMVRAIARGPVAQHEPDSHLTVWAYSGYRFEQLIAGIPNEYANELLQELDVLVDGLYIESQRSLDLCWRGSANQRVIDVPASLAKGKIIEIPFTSS